MADRQISVPLLACHTSAENEIRGVECGFVWVDIIGLHGFYASKCPAPANHVGGIVAKMKVPE